jgi:PPOX class probable F420-dependent enzyme
VIPESHVDLLDGPSFAHVATIGPDGAPQSSPVWIDWDGDHVKFSQTTTRQKYRNLRRDPRVAMSMIDPENPYRYLEVRGRVARIEDDPDKAFIDRLAKKYLGLDTYPNHQPGEERVIVYVEPERTSHMG